MQFRHKIVLALAAMFMAVSCITVDKKLGEDMIPGNQNLPVNVAVLDLPVQLKSSQPLQTTSSSEGAFGAASQLTGKWQFSVIQGRRLFRLCRQTLSTRTVVEAIRMPTASVPAVISPPT